MLDKRNVPMDPTERRETLFALQRNVPVVIMEERGERKTREHIPYRVLWSVLRVQSSTAQEVKDDQRLSWISVTSQWESLSNNNREMNLRQEISRSVTQKTILLALKPISFN
ncbi:hypothetical protein WN51_13399 [Melipona quadrifasciata]|uniref:Uncharacterized protein n=1 Tax=Melipona quadrifasciata TaxID=166423 RepID=A0A0N0BGP3_9HYME|nr:hypothetical protein WN51_13399 [Melipona quadrifasciata]